MQPDLSRRRSVYKVSCGTIVTDGARVLLGHAPPGVRWDIPKGVAEPGEAHAAAAVRELREETGLSVPPDALLPLGLHAYLRGKDLALFLWRPPAMPDPELLVCRSFVRLPDGRRVPELDGFAVLPWAEALARVGRNLAHVLREVGDEAGFGRA